MIKLMTRNKLKGNKKVIRNKYYDCADGVLILDLIVGFCQQQEEIFF